MISLLLSFVDLAAVTVGFYPGLCVCSAASRVCDWTGAANISPFLFEQARGYMWETWVDFWSWWLSTRLTAEQDCTC